MLMRDARAAIVSAGSSAEVDQRQGFELVAQAAIETAANADMRGRARAAGQAARAPVAAGDATGAAIAGIELGALLTEARLGPLAEKGRRFSGRRRGLSTLYAAAVAVLQRVGPNISTHATWRDLKAAGVVRGGSDVLHWQDCHGRLRSTRMEAFAQRLSVHRARLRKINPSRLSAKRESEGSQSAARAPTVLANG